MINSAAGGAGYRAAAPLALHNLKHGLTFKPALFLATKSGGTHGPVLTRCKSERAAGKKTNTRECLHIKLHPNTTARGYESKARMILPGRPPPLFSLRGSWRGTTRLHPWRLRCPRLLLDEKLGLTRSHRGPRALIWLVGHRPHLLSE